MADSMLEDISNLLQFAEIPEVFTAEDKKEIYEKMEMIDNQRDKALQVCSYVAHLLNTKDISRKQCPQFLFQALIFLHSC